MKTENSGFSQATRPQIFTEVYQSAQSISYVKCPWCDRVTVVAGKPDWVHCTGCDTTGIPWWAALQLGVYVPIFPS